MKENEITCPTLIHYGSTKFETSFVDGIRNSIKSKPYGGFWAFPIDSEHGWKHWCQENDFEKINDDLSFILILKPGTKILRIDSYADLEVLPKISSYSMLYPDFELLSKSYDAIWLTAKGERETHGSYPLDLCDWDCESVLIMNVNCIEQI